MPAADLRLLDHRDRSVPERLEQLWIVSEQLQQPVGGREPRRAAADDRHTNLDQVILGVELALDELVLGCDRRRKLARRCHRYAPFFALIATVNFGRSLLRSPTIPRSENSKIGAFASLLIATMFSEDCMPTLC